MQGRGHTLCTVAYIAIIIGSWALGATQGFGAATLRVDATNGADVFGCGSQATPCASIQMAVNEAESADTILVAEGTYTYNQAVDTCPTDFTAVVCLRNIKLTILGGYGGGNWSVSDPLEHETIIDGENAERGVLVYTGVEDSGLVMEGFTIRRGMGTANSSDINAWGGGVFAKVADLTLRNMVIENSTVRGMDMTSGRGGTGAGGCIAVKGNAESRWTAVFENVICDGNKALGGDGPERGGRGQGGGLWINHSDATGDRLVFTNNSAISANSNGDGNVDGTAGAQGGGVAFKEGSVSYFTNVTSVGNVVRGGNANASFGAAGFAFGAGLYGERATFTVVNAEVRGNASTGGDADTAGGSFGGGVYALDCDANLDQAVIIDNTSTGGQGASVKGTAGGGGCHFSDNDGAAGGRQITITNSVIADNTVVLGTGGGLVGGGGGGFFLNGSHARLTHCTVANNSLSVSPPMEGIAVVIVTRTPDTTPVPASMVFEYGIISDHGDSPGDAAIQVKEDSKITFGTGLFANNGVNVNGDGDMVGLQNMADTTAIEYASPGAPNYDYHLDSLSPAIDEAVGSTTLLDVDGATRDNQPDLGADEFGATLFAFAVQKVGGGLGTVTSFPAGIDCGASCETLFQNTTVVELSAVVGADSLFNGFGGHPDCDDGVVTVNGDRTCEAYFLSVGLFSNGFEGGGTSGWSSASP